MIKNQQIYYVQDTDPKYTGSVVQEDHCIKILLMERKTLRIIRFGRPLDQVGLNYIKRSWFVHLSAVEIYHEDN